MTDINDNKINLTARVVDDGVELGMELFGGIYKELIDMRAKLQDKAIRQYLINQGWTPPIDDKEIT